VAAVSEVRAVPDDVVYGFGRMDESGRVADRAMTSALGRQPGDRLTLTAAAGVVIARRDPAGLVTLPAKRSWSPALSASTPKSGSPSGSPDGFSWKA
jgi:hypothetical protein